MEKLYIVIPAYNEEENIETVAREWHEIVQKTGEASRLVIIDDGSGDSTYQKLCALKTELPQMEPLRKKNGGHGAALLYGYRHALKAGADYIFQTDSDGQTLPGEFWAFWECRHETDAVIGCRTGRQDGISRIFVTKVLKLVLRMVFRLDVPDANTPFRLMRRELLDKYIGQVPAGFNLSNVLLTVLFLNGREKVRFIPVTFRPRQGGTNSINMRKIIKIGMQAVRDFRMIRRNLRGGYDRCAVRPAGCWKNTGVFCCMSFSG